jgi:hypothetical protein
VRPPLLSSHRFYSSLLSSVTPSCPPPPNPSHTLSTTQPPPNRLPPPTRLSKHATHPRALKTKHETPKYGLIYHASLIGQSQPKNKGKISRVLAAKCALAIRVDALGDSVDATVGMEAREKVRVSVCSVLVRVCLFAMWRPFWV